MATFERIIVLLLGAALLAALARKVGAPYPTFLALGGVLLAFVPASTNWTLGPHLALALFVAPVLLDAAYDTSLLDLRANWRPVAGLVIAAVGTTVLAVALTARWLVPEMAWPGRVTMAPLIRRMGLTDDDQVGGEIRLGRTHAYRALLEAIKDDDTLAGKLLRKEYSAVVEMNDGPAPNASVEDVPGGPLRRRAIAVARQRAFEPRRDDVIGDDVYRVLVQELDWAELSAGGGRTP